MQMSFVAAVICCVSCTLLRLAAGQAETPALPGVLAALNISDANVSTVVLPDPATTSAIVPRDAANVTSDVATPAANISTQPPLGANSTGAGDSSNTTGAGNASSPLPQPWVGQLANTSANASSNATRDAGSTATDVLAEYITLSNNLGMTVVVLPLGAIIQRLIVPDKNGTGVDVALGMDAASEYLALNPNPYLGAVIGRVSNRIPGANFTLNGVTYSTSVNDVIPEPGSNSSVPTLNDTIHGGASGFSMRVWDARKVALADGEAAVLHLLSPDGDQGFPGTVHAWVIYKLWADTNRLQTTWLATTDKPTPISMTTHAYFNLNGHNSSTNVTDHTVQLHANYYTPVYNNTIVPTGEIAPVAGTPFDLRQPTILGIVIDQVPGPDVPPGYDINMITPLGYPNATNLTQPSPRPVLVANISAPVSGITMGVLTNAPGFQWYSGNHLPGPGEPQITGKSGAQYVRRGGFAIEPQGWPNAVQQPNFPSVIVNPGQIYEQQLVWEFGVQGGSNATAAGSETAANETAPVAANTTEVPAAADATAENGTVPANVTVVPAANATDPGPVVVSATEIGLGNATAPVVVNATLPDAATPTVVTAPDVVGSNVVVAENATGDAAAAAGGSGATP